MEYLDVLAVKIVGLNRIVYCAMNYVGPAVVEYLGIRVREIIVTDNWATIVTTHQECSCSETTVGLSSRQTSHRRLAKYVHRAEERVTR